MYYYFLEKKILSMKDKGSRKKYRYNKKLDKFIETSVNNAHTGQSVSSLVACTPDMGDKPPNILIINDLNISNSVLKMSK